MKNKTTKVGSFTTVKLLAKIPWILAIVFTMTAATCGTKSGGSSSSGGGGSTEGQLIITGMDDYIGCYIAAIAFVNITAAADVKKVNIEDGGHVTAYPAKITGGTVKLNVWRHISGSFVDYTGTDDSTGGIFYLYFPEQGGKEIYMVLNEETMPFVKYMGSGQPVWTNGNATINNSDINWSEVAH